MQPINYLLVKAVQKASAQALIPRFHNHYNIVRLVCWFKAANCVWSWQI